MPTPALARSSLPEPTAETRQLISALFQPGMALTQEQAVQWKQSLRQLLQEGAAAVPAVREFLARNVDLDFGLEGSKILGYASVRTAMLDALQQIGGPEALSLMLETLQTTSDPREIALLALNLEGQAPEQYRQEAITAAREALAMAAEGKLDGRDVGPLFEVLQKLGGAAAVSDLEQAAGQWKYYASVSLAQLTDGAGIPTLIQMARDPAAAGKGTLGVALEMLARVAPQYPEARSALIEQARQNKIPPNLWPYVASSLTGDQYQYRESVFDSSAATSTSSDLKAIHINFGNQNLYSSGGGRLSPDQINQQLSLIDELLLANNDSSAVDPLQQSRDLLLKRLSRATAGPAPGR